MSIYRINLGSKATLFERCCQNRTIAIFNELWTHGFWLNRDREGFVVAAMSRPKPGGEDNYDKKSASRLYNLGDELLASDHDIWITHVNGMVWWTRSMPGLAVNTILKGVDPGEPSREVWVLERPCEPWRATNLYGKPMVWNSSLSSMVVPRETFNRLSPMHAAAFMALLEGRLVPQGDSYDLNEAAAVSPLVLSALMMTATMLATTSYANGQEITRKVKIKNTSLTQKESAELCEALMRKQNEKCAITGIALQYEGAAADPELLASLDRIDSDGHYTPDNLQVVCRFINRWKRADDDALTRRLIGVIRGSAG